MRNYLTFNHYIFVIFPLCFISSSCVAQPQADNRVDYSQLENWISRESDEQIHDVDLFYVYPTVDFSKTPKNMELSDLDLKSKAKGVFTEHSGVYSSSTNLFAPYYRQVSIAVLSLSSEESESYLSIGYNDVKSAFNYYLEHYNNGRPFILAGHSQGSDMIACLMKDIFDDKLLLDKLIAAYIIGFSVTDEELENYKWLKIAQKADDVGVIITYNTQSVDATGSPVLMPGANCVNPLSWSTSTDLAKKQLNKGAVFFNDNHQIEREIINYSSAQIDENGALIAATPSPDDFYSPTNFFPKGVYHAYDYSFFYRNLEENVKVRVEAYFNNP